MLFAYKGLGIQVELGIEMLKVRIQKYLSIDYIESFKNTNKN